MKPCTKVSARRVGGRFILYRAGRVAGESVHSGPALDWLSEQLRIPGHELSSLSDLTGADVAAHRADQSALICGADWRVSQE